MSRRAEALLRALVGVHEAEVSFRPGGSIASVRVATAGISSGLVIRNIRSALMAGLGVSIDPPQIELLDPAAWVAGDVPAPIEASSEPPPTQGEDPNSEELHAAPAHVQGNGSAAGSTAHRHPPVPATNGHGGNGGNGGSATAASAGIPGVRPNSNGANTNGGTNGHAAAGEAAARPSPASPLLAQPERRRRPVGADRPVRPEITNGESVRAPRVERVDLVRHAGRLRCRVVIAAGEERFTAIADTADEPGAEIQLAGRVACDALRAGGLTGAQFESANVAYLGGRVHIVAALGDWKQGEPCPRSGSAVASESLEHATARAVLQAALATA